MSGYLKYRDDAVDRLFQEAAGNPTFFRNNTDSRSALLKLAKYSGKRSTDMLLRIALGQSAPWASTQADAIKALSERREPEIATELAILLQPHQALEIRRAVAKSLETLPCEQECVASILHYLERISRGELNYEDAFVYPADLAPVLGSHKEQQLEVYKSLDLVLQQRKADTLAVLVAVYGLGSVEPSEFALDVIARTQLTEACPLLQQSAQAEQSLPPSRLRAPRDQVQAAISSLHCH
jgi:hypothetical protein